jgi:hypothetical protein
MAIPFFYDYAASFSQGFALVRKGEYHFYIASNGVEYYEKG